MLPLWALVGQKRACLFSSGQLQYRPFAGHGSKDEGSAINQQEGGVSAQPVDIQIFGHSLRVNYLPSQRDVLNRTTDDLDQRSQDLKERIRVTDTEQLVFIAALNTSYELAQEKTKTCDYAVSMEQHTRMLQQTVEQALLE